MHSSLEFFSIILNGQKEESIIKLIQSEITVNTLSAFPDHSKRLSGEGNLLCAVMQLQWNFCLMVQG